MAAYHLFRILWSDEWAGHHEHSIPLLVILRRELRQDNGRTSKLIFMERQTMPAICNMLRSIHLHGEPVFVQIDQGEIQNVSTVFPGLLDI